jgi:hypothetical protein
LVCLASFILASLAALRFGFQELPFFLDFRVSDRNAYSKFYFPVRCQIMTDRLNKSRPFQNALIAASGKQDKKGSYPNR